MSAKELRIGVIGCGGRGALARHAHKPEEGVHLVAATDTVPKCLEDFSREFPGSFVTDDYRKLLRRKDIDAVFVTTPDFCHEQHAVAAIKAGKCVYLEKPMAITIRGCDRILREAYKKRVKLYLGHNMRHFNVIRKMKELIDGGAIGRVKAGWCRHFLSYGGDSYFKDWHADRTKSTGMLLQKAAHDIDVLHWLCGGYSQKVAALGNLTVYNQITDRHPPEERGDKSWRLENWPPLSQKGLNPVLDIEDLSMMLMELDNGVLCSYQQCHYTPDAWRNYTIIGDAGRVENFGDDKGAVVRLWNKRHYYHPQGDAEFDTPPATGTHGGADPRIVAEFVRYVRQGGKIATSAVAARNSVAAGFQATKSLRCGGRPQLIPPVPKEIDDYFSADVATTV